MAFTRRTRTGTPTRLTSVPTRNRRPRSLVAAAEPLVKRLETSNQVEPGWQRLVWELYDQVPELRTAARVTAGAMSQCRLILARVSGNGDPVPLDYGTAEKPGPDAAHPARALLDGFAGGLGGQAALLDALGVYLTVTGESILVGALDPDMARLDPDLMMQAYSPGQVVVRNRQIALKTDESSQADKIIEESAGNTAVRVWRPHPAKSWEADSAARGAIPILQEIILYDQHLRATAMSRLAGAGILFVPEGMTLPGPAEDDGTEDDGDPFMRLLMEVMGTAIKDRDSVAAMVPILIRGEGEDITAVRHLMFSTPFDEKVLELRASAIERLAVAVDMPPEMLTGLGGLQHWTGSLITDSWVNTYMAELMGLVCGSLTTGWLWPALAKIAPDMPSDLILWYDPSAIRTRPNVGPEAQALYDRNEISGDALRRASGFDDGDAPEPKDLERGLLIALVKGAPSLAPVILPILGINLPGAAEDAIAETDQPADETTPPVSTPTPGSVEPQVSAQPAAAAAVAREFAQIVQAQGNGVTRK